MTDGWQGDEGPGALHPDDLAPDDLVGSASARLLATGVGRRERLTALRLLGLLGDHADAERRVRRPLADLAAEFELPEADLAPALTALARVGALTVDVRRGLVTLAGAEGADRGGLRLDAFLANVGRSFDEDLVAGVADEPALEPVAPAAARGTAGRRRRVPLVAVPDLPAAIDPDGPATTGAPGEVLPVEVRPLVLAPLPNRGRAASPWQRPLRAGAAALVAAAAALVLAAAPGELRGPDRALDAAVGSDVEAGPGAPATGAGPARPTTVPTVRSLDGTTTTSGATTTTGSAVPAAPRLDGLAPVAPAPGAPSGSAGSPSAVAASPGTSTPTPSLEPGPAGPLPTPGAPCIPLAPALEVLDVSDLDAAPVGGAERLSAVRGTVRNPFDEALVLDGIVVEVVLSDGSTRTVTTTTPLAVPAGELTGWAAEVPLGEPGDDVSARSASAEPTTWSVAGGGTGSGCGS